MKNQISWKGNRGDKQGVMVTRKLRHTGKKKWTGGAYRKADARAMEAAAVNFKQKKKARDAVRKSSFLRCQKSPPHVYIPSVSF